MKTGSDRPPHTHGPSGTIHEGQNVDTAQLSIRGQWAEQTQSAHTLPCCSTPATTWVTPGTPGGVEAGGHRGPRGVLPSQPSEVAQPGPHGRSQSTGTGKTGPKPDRWSPGLGQGEGRGMMLTGCGASSGEMRMFRNQAELLAAQRRERAKCHGAVHFRMVKTMTNFYVNFYN